MRRPAEKESTKTRKSGLASTLAPPGSGEAPFRFYARIGTMNLPLTRPSGTLSPSAGERDGVRGRFMESPLSFFRMHWDHEPDWHPSPCPLPARRGEGGRRPG